MKSRPLSNPMLREKAQHHEVSILQALQLSTFYPVSGIKIVRAQEKGAFQFVVATRALKHTASFWT